MSGILGKYTTLEVLTDDGRAHELVKSFSTMSEAEHALHYAGNAFCGQAFIKDSPGEQQAILEIVIASDGADSVATLFRPHPLFNSRDSYRKGREELFQVVLDLADAGVNGVAVMCPLRKRKVNVRDLGVKQLIEIIQSAVNTWQDTAPAVKH